MAVNVAAQDEHKTQLIELLRDLPSVMFITSPDDKLTDARGKPMSIAKVGSDGTLYFLTSDKMEKDGELRSRNSAMCTGQTKTQYARLSGAFELTRNQALVDELWSKMAEVWFPAGKTDPTIRVLQFHPTSAETWDLSGMKGIAYLLSSAQAWLTNTTPKDTGETHARITL